MVRTQHKTAPVLRHLGIVQGAFQGDDVFQGQFFPSCGIRLPAGGDHRSLACMAVWSQGVRSLLVTDTVDGVPVTLDIKRELVIGNCIKLVIRHTGGLCLEFVQPDGDVILLQILYGYGIGGVVHQHVRIGTHIHQVDDLVVHSCGIVRYPVKERRRQSRTELSDQLSRPYFGVHTLHGGTGRHESLKKHRHNYSRGRTVCGADPHH